MSLVDSCPSTETRSNERFTHTPEQQVGGLGLQRRVGLDEAQHRGEARRDHPGALALGAQAHRAPTAARPRGWRASRTRRSSGSPAGSRRRRRRCSCALASRMPFSIASTGSCMADRRRSRRARPRPVARPTRERRGALGLGGVVEPALAGGGVGAAGVGEHGAQRVQPAALAAEQHGRGRQWRSR